MERASSLNFFTTNFCRAWKMKNRQMIIKLWRGKREHREGKSFVLIVHHLIVVEKMQLNILITEQEKFSLFFPPSNMIRENSHQITQFSLIIHNEVFDEQAPQVDIFFCLSV